MRKAQRDVDLARESIEDDRKRLQAKDSRLSELATETHEKHHAINQCVPLPCSLRVHTPAATSVLLKQGATYIVPTREK